MRLLKVVSEENPREIAAQILQRRAAGRFVEDLLVSALSKNTLSGADRHLCQELVYGVVRWQRTLDYLVALKTGGRQQNAQIRNFLHLGLYQLLWLDRIPPHAAVNETVEMARRAGFGPQSGFINAVLRGYDREKAKTLEMLKELQTRQPEIGYSHPKWLVDRWQHRWGKEAAAALFQWDNSPPPLFARPNTLRGATETLLTQWRDENVDYDFVFRDWLEENTIFRLKGHPPIQGLASFQQGRFYLQDPSTLLAVRLLDPQPGESVLDLCAAPGGKLGHIAQLMRNEGVLVGHDPSEERLKLVQENVTRLGISIAQLTSAAPVAPATFDRVLVDAPCSNTGVMRRRVDLRWRVSEEEIARLRGTQTNLLKQAAFLIKPGGLLVYSTCSLEPEENRQVVENFLSTERGFELAAERELTPFRDNVDGAYAAALRVRA